MKTLLVHLVIGALVWIAVAGDSVASFEEASAMNDTQVVARDLSENAEARALQAGGTTLQNLNFATPYVGWGSYYSFSYAGGISGYTWYMDGSSGISACTYSGFTSGNPCPPTGNSQIMFFQTCGYPTICAQQQGTFPAGVYTVGAYAANRWNQGYAYISAYLQICETNGAVIAQVYMQPASLNYYYYVTASFWVSYTRPLLLRFQGALSSWSPYDQTLFIGYVQVNPLTSCSPSAAPAGATVSRTSGTTWTFSCVAGYYGTSTSQSSNSASAPCSISGSTPTCYYCDAGYYCSGGNSRVACAAGTYSTSSGLTSQAQCATCPGGYYCSGGSAIALCGAGSYSTTPGLSSQGQCWTCPAGYYCSGGSAAVLCAAGTFSTTTGLWSQSQCSVCTAGYYCSGGSARTLCAAGTYSSSTGLTAQGECTTCPAGYYCSGGSAIALCSAGTYSTATGRTSQGQCLTCPAGYYCPGGSQATPCAAGSYSSSTGLSSQGQCTTCPAGSYCTGGAAIASCSAGTYSGTAGLTSQSQCTTCPGGYYCTGGANVATCIAGTYSSTPGLTAATQCTNCPGGYYCSGGSAISLCPAGRYSSTAGLTASSQCTLCPVANFCTGGSAIAVCAAGTYTTSTGLQSQGQCTVCETGYYCASGNQLGCPAGRYGATTGLSTSTQCTLCPLGSYCTGLAALQSCPAGRYGTATGLTAMSACTVCPVTTTAGHYCTGGDSLETCPSGTYAATSGLPAASECTVCDLTYYCTNGVRTVCPPGKAGLTVGLLSATACSTCAVGYYCTNGQQTVCPPGTYGSATGLQSAAQCTQCEVNYYCTGGERNICPPGTLNTAPGATACTIPCPKGYYCVNNVQTICPAGVFSAVTGLGTASCSGPCPPGYYCPAGTQNPTTYACGDASVYCAQGSAAPSPVTSGYYSTPETGPANLRTGQAPCPAFRQCVNGVMLPAISLAGNCSGNLASAFLQDSITNTEFGPNFTVSTPGYTGAVTYSILSIRPADPTCVVSASNFSMVNYGSFARLRVNSSPIYYVPCSNGLRITFAANRSTTPALSDFCSVDVTVGQIIKAPVITDCGFRSVAERSVPGTPIGLPLTATSPNAGTSIFWSINYVSPGNPPIAISTCSGQLSVLTPFAWATAKAYQVRVNVTNDGSAMGMGSATVQCTTYVNVTMVPTPPTPTVTSFYIAEASPISTVVGNVNGADINNFPFNCSWSAVDTPNVFSISPSCVISVAAHYTIFPSLKSVFTYSLRMTNGYASSTTPITINLLAVPQPPITYPQTRSIMDNAAAGTTMTPALVATSAQDLQMTFQVINPVQFNVTAAGVLYRTSVGTVDYTLQRNHTVTFVVRDSNGLTAMSTATITLIDSNKPPAFTQPNGYAFTISEGAVIGSAVSGPSLITAVDPNVGQSLTYTVRGVNPTAGARFFDLHSQSGLMFVGSAAADTGGKLLYDRAMTYPKPFTFFFNVSVHDNGSPTMWANTTVNVTIVNIAPRLTTPGNAYVVTGSALGGHVLMNVGDLLWTPYPASVLSFAMTSDAFVPGGSPAFQINAATGEVRIAGVVGSVPPFDYNARRAFRMNVTVTDTTTGLSASTTLNAALQHFNRPPAWLPIPTIFAAGATSADIGRPLSAYITDPDIDVSEIREYFNYTIVGGNAGGTFRIDGATGQISVADNSTAEFDPTNPAGRSTFNLTVMARDAGINGPQYGANTTVTIAVVMANFAPNVPFTNLTVNELVPVGTIVGYIQATSRIAVTNITYQLMATGNSANLPFPFNITTVAGGINNNGQGVIKVTGPVEWNAFTTYYGAVTATTSDFPRYQYPLSSSGLVQINVRYVAQAPHFHVSAATPRHTFVWTLSVKERAAVGTNVSAAGLVARSKDPWQLSQLRYSWLQNNTALFRVDPVTAVVTVAQSGLVYNQQTQYSLTLLVVDIHGLNDTATVVINVEEINNAAIFTRLADANNQSVAFSTPLIVLETAPAGTVFGYITADDPNRYGPWGEEVYSLVLTNDSLPFSIDAATGALSVANPTLLDFWDQNEYTLNISVRDADPFAPPIRVYQVISVRLLQANRITVSGFAVPPSVPNTIAMNSSAVLWPDILDTVDVLFATEGAANILVFGRGFGWTPRYLSANPAAPPTLVNASFISGGVLVRVACSIAVPNTVLNCTVPPGSGRMHVWTVNVNAMSATSVRRTSYFPPTISNAVKVVEAGDSSLLSTLGGEHIRISGRNLGPVGATVSLVYGLTALTYASPTCVVESPGHVSVLCTTVAGVGANLTLRLTVAGLASPDFISTVKYSPPQVDSVEAPFLQTAGGEVGAITVHGSGFGPASNVGILLEYSADNTFSGSFYPIFTASSCFIPADGADVRITCTSAAGLGRNLSVRVAIGGQNSLPTDGANTLHYLPPVITNVAGAGADGAITQGGQQINIHGFNFGPVTPLTAGGAAIPGALVPAAYYGRYPADSRKYRAVDCRVTSPNTLITCLTAEGTGFGLTWLVEVGEQASDVLRNRSTSYAPPVISSYDGPGASRALTEGGQNVVIYGDNFGPAGTVIEDAMYSMGANSTVFYATNCTLLQPHKAVQCLTAEGAGAGLAWQLKIDGQRSVAPTTNYGRPVIASFDGNGSTDASTNGGQTVRLTGSFFSKNEFLNSVTYGPTGLEFVAKDCAVTIPHTEITCTTVAGAGRKLRWFVTVAGQTSDLSASFTSYAAPAVTQVSPNNGVTSGGYPVTIIGENFGIRHTGGNIIVKLNNVGLTEPSQEDWNTHLQSVHAGGSGLPSVLTWLNDLSTLKPTAVGETPSGLHTLTVVIPEGFGPSCALIVIVDGVPSPIFRWQYAPPLITNIAPDRQNVSAGFLRVFIDGQSFCNGLLGCGVVQVDNATMQVRQWSATSIMFIMPDLLPTQPPVEVVVIVAGVRSNVLRFSKPVPNLSNLVSQEQWINMDTRGNQQLSIYGVMNIGTEPVSIYIGTRECVNVTRTLTNNMPEADPAAEYTLRCLTPAGVGTGLPITVRALGGASRVDDSFSFSYAAPSLSSLSLLASGRVLSAVNVPTVGMNASITGQNLGSPETNDANGCRVVLDGIRDLQILLQTDTEIVVAIPPGDGANHFIEAIVGGQTSAPLVFAYEAPSITSVSPPTGPTTGGTLLTIRGANFGVHQPTVFLGALPCNVELPFSPAPQHDVIYCRTVVGQGKQLSARVTVTQQSSSSSIMWRYDAPSLQSIAPPVVPTSGRMIGQQLSNGVEYSQGAAIVLTIRGSNFGVSGNVSFVATELSDALSMTKPLLPQHITSWNHTVITLLCPEGFGTHLRVVVTVSGQSSPSNTSVALAYEPPVVFNITRADRIVTECSPRRECFTFDNVTRCEVAAGGCYDTAGGYPVVIVGYNFGVQDVLAPFTVVKVGVWRCLQDVTLPQSHSTLTCIVPQGLGDRNPVSVQIGQQTSTSLLHFAFDPPVVLTIMPNTPDARGGQIVTFRGKNMGFVATAITITINALPCQEAQWIADARIQCLPQADVVGPKNVSILVANRTDWRRFYDVAQVYVSVCQYGYFGMVGEMCSECPVGAACPGNELYSDMVTALPGFWRYNVSAPDDRCSEQTQQRVTHGCPVFVACSPAESCLGVNTCAEGYEGDRCALCMRGQYYRLNGACVKCPSSVYAVWLGMGLTLLVFAGFAYWMNRKNISIALIAIGVDYAQVLSMFAATKINWPPMILQIFDIMSAFNLNLDLTAPECLVPTVTWWMKFSFIELLPVTIIVLFGVLVLLRIAAKSLCRSPTKEQLYSHLPSFISTSILIFRLLFLYITRTSMNVMNCAPLKPSDGHEYMAGDVTTPCWESGSLQVTVFPFALCALMLYTVAIPCAMFVFMRRRLLAIKTDQLLRAKGVGDDKMTNPKYLTFRKSYSRLYYHFKPGRWYWELIIFARKAMLSFTSLMFRSTPSYQLAMALLILFVAYVLHMRALPYLTHGNKAQVVAEHEKKALTNSMHAIIAADMRNAEARHLHGKRRHSSVLDVKAHTRHTSTVVLLSLFDYNVAEAVLLASALLTILAGIMFDSGRFTGADLLSNRAEYDSLSGAVVFLIGATVIYFFVVLLLDLCVVLCPSRAAAVFTLCSKAEDATRKRLIRGVGGRGGAAVVSVAAHKAGFKHGGGSDAGHNAGMMMDSGMSLNPIMLKQSLQRTSADSEDAIEGVVNPDQVSAMGPPAAPMWPSIQASYTKLANMVRDLQRALADEKRVAGARSEDVFVGVDRAGGRIRRQFEPMMRAAEGNNGGNDPSVHRQRLLSSFAAASSASLGRTRSGHAKLPLTLAARKSTLVLPLPSQNHADVPTKHTPSSSEQQQQIVRNPIAHTNMISENEALSMPEPSVIEKTE